MVDSQKVAQCCQEMYNWIGDDMHEVVGKWGAHEIRVVLDIREDSKQMKVYYNGDDVFTYDYNSRFTVIEAHQKWGSIFLRIYNQVRAAKDTDLKEILTLYSTMN